MEFAAYTRSSTASYSSRTQSQRHSSTKNGVANNVRAVAPLSYSSETKSYSFRVLVVEDSEMCRKSMIMILKRCIKVYPLPIDLLIDQVGDGLEMIEKVSGCLHTPGEFYDLIFVDNVMETMHGVEATKLVRDLGFAGIIAAVTGNILQQDVDEFLAAGADVVLQKPLLLNDLHTLLNQSFFKALLELKL